MKSWNEIRKAATAFSKRWKNAYDEKSQAQSFLKELCAVFGVDTVVFNAFEHRVKFTQGEQIAPLWKNLSVEIDFACRTFNWHNEAKGVAAVHCVIIGFHAKGERASRPFRTAGTAVPPVRPSTNPTARQSP